MRDRADDFMATLKTLLTALIALAQRWPGLIALFGFVSGAASYLLIERSESLAQVIAAVMLGSWVLLVLENWLRAGFLKRFGLDMPPALMHYVTQMVHQESLFFTLPFFLAVTSWDHGQAVFTALLVLCALISVIDPIYYKQLATRRALFVAFHALALFAVLLVALPLMLQLTTAQSLALALLMSMLFSLPSLFHLLNNQRWWRLPLMAVMLMALAAGLWQARAWIPPAALKLTGISLSQKMDRALRTPGEELEQLDAATLKAQGLFAWTAVRAPRGLREKIHHVWLHNGNEVDRITLDIRGGRDQGYRAWTFKSNFPRDPVGNWQVQVITDSGQLIGLTRFTVTAGREVPATKAAPEENQESHSPELSETVPTSKPPENRPEEEHQLRPLPESEPVSDTAPSLPSDMPVETETQRVPDETPDGLHP